MTDDASTPLRNSRHEAFAQAMARGSSATAAYVEAGYSPKYANRNAHKLTSNNGIRHRVAHLKSEIVDETVMSAKETLARLSDLARNGSDREKLGALNSLMRYYGLFQDRLDYTTDGESFPQVSIYIPDNGRDKPLTN